MKFQEFVDDQVFSPVLIADALRTTKSEIAGTLGLGRDAFLRASRIRARKTQIRLRQMLEILNRFEGEGGERQRDARGTRYRAQRRRRRPGRAGPCGEGIPLKRGSGRDGSA